MPTIFKLLVSALFIYLMVLGFYKLYVLLNDKITGSKNILQLVGYAMLLIVANLLLFFGGLLLLFEVYLYLS
jgi:hypothetical protein